MIDSVRSPIDVGGKNVFVLNDIDLVVPPTQIEIRNENLTYQYRTLRTKSATKVPTGHGQSVTNVSIPFVQSDWLSLHRLIVEFRFSPFFYIDNRYIRESIVPEWPFSQNMAMTVTSLNITSMPGTSDTLVAELDMLWFNYFPFMHNYFFREEWQTNWMRDQKNPQKAITSSIGWSLNKEYVKTHSGCILQTRDHSDNKPIYQLNEQQSVYDPRTSWSINQNDFQSSSNRTIFEMEAQHPGIEFDLLPIPGNMMPARIVTQPRYSFIYVRFMNLLQRDALYKNFGIDVEADLIAYEQAHKIPGLRDSFFNIGKDEAGNPFVFGLHTHAVPKELRSKWISQMAEFNHEVKFMYNAYKEIRLPQKFTENVQNKRNSAVINFSKQVGYYRDRYKNTEQVSKDADPVSLVLFDTAHRITSKFEAFESLRKHPHDGVDFGVVEGTPLYSPVSGTVEKITPVSTGDSTKPTSGNMITIKADSGARWSFMHLSQMAVKVPDVIEVGQVIGRTGNTGNSTGPHLHVRYIAPNSNKSSDCYPELQRIYELQTIPESIVSDEVYEMQLEAAKQANAQEVLLELSKAQTQTALGATNEEIDAMSELFQLLDEEGWTFYDKDSSITNLWEKQFILKISHSGLDTSTGRTQIPEQFRHAGIICTSIGAGLTHIVSKIPILSQEWPTHQHLGSTEPNYQLEFAVLDDQADLEGIGSMAQLVQGMRSTLQSNSRKFRPVLDGHVVATDTFITRLLGSYENNDFKVLEFEGQIADYELKKRTIISNSYSGTVPGNPGLSVINFTMQETNPYDLEKIRSTSPSYQDKEASREQVLQAIYNKKVVPEYASLIAALLIGSKINPNILNPKDPTFGKFSVKTSPSESIREPYVYTGDIQFALGYDLLVFPYESQSELDMLNSLGAKADTKGWDPGWASVPVPYFGDGLSDQTFNSNFDNITGVNSVAPDEKLIDNLDRTTKILHFDLAILAKQGNSDLDFAAVSRFIDYYIGISKALETGERIFAEFEVGGLTKEFLSNGLYHLPVKNNMWKCWQLFLQEFTKQRNVIAGQGGDATKQLMDNPAWPRLNHEPWADPYPEELRPGLSKAAGADFISGGWSGINLFNEPLEKAGYTIAAGLSSNTDLATRYREKRKNAINRLVNFYYTTLPFNFSVPDWLKSTYKTTIGSVFNNIGTTSGSSTVPALQSTFKDFYDNADSCGNITYNYIQGTDEPVWVVTNEEMGIRGGYLGFFDPNLALITGLVDVPFQQATGSQFSPAFAAADELISSGLSAVGLEETLRPFQKVGNTPNSPFIYPVAEGVEQQKLFYIKNILASFSDGILSDYPVLKILGLEKLMFHDYTMNTGGDCYPDIDLPAHPYYGDSKLVAPDFFMWNIYEDGNALNIEEQNRIYTQVEAVVANSYQSMKRKEHGDKFDPISETVLSESSVDDPLAISTQISPEGTDGHKTNGPSSSPFYPVTAAAADTDSWIRQINSSSGLTSASRVAAAGFGLAATAITETTIAVGSKDSVELYSTKPSDFLHGLRVSNTEGLFGGGDTGIQYPARLTSGQYDQLKTEFQSTKQMFGSVEGYMNQQLDEKNFPTVAKGLDGTNLERSFEAAHTFDLASLKKLSRDSAKDLLSQKMTLKRAYPTFKLFFIEEDEFETRFINFDDFYSYNAVKSFTVVLSRKIPADTAVISLQNIQGSLDGTRRNTITDLDYFSNDVVSKKLDAVGNTEASQLSGVPSTTNTDAEQPFGAVVLRPGLNVQLRAGFSNDPDNLHVLLSGRIVDLTWNASGDLAEIMVQSFGAELAQVIKGTARDEQIVTYSTTHQLLGSLMLEPEVTHFGRWEFGQTYFVGEAKNHKLDFIDYNRIGYLGKFTATNSIMNWVYEHPKTLLAAGLAATAVSFLPWGAVGKVAGKSKYLAGFFKGSASEVALWETGYRAVSGTPANAAEKALAEAGLVKAIDTSLDRLALAAIKASGNAAEMVAATSARVSAAKGTIVGEILTGTPEAIEKAIKTAADTERYLQTAVFKSQWMTKPWVEAGQAGFMSAIGTKPIRKFLSILFVQPGKVAAAGILLGVGLDITTMTNDFMGAGKLEKWIKQFFARKQTTMFLTPQDDNLFPPHPKDYMTMDETILQTAEQFVLRAGSSTLIGDPTFADGLYRLLNPDLFLSKKARPSAFKYQPITSTIWDMFEEMSIRHPGWISAARPYGNAFRYTMFFGLPSQRYWARPGSNGFVYRANQLRKTLDTSPNGPAISRDQFEQLYGKAMLEEVMFKIDSVPLLNKYGEPEFDIDKKIHEEQQLGAYALKEYLRAVQVRFEPFRRYHLLTSERDIIWNGIMGSENAVYNAVDVTYFANDDASVLDLGESVKTSIFKAHPFIPEPQLRIAPVRWPNCKGYTLAMRYGMGELVNRMKDMYKGEILITGNARVRPWDIAILVDTYNDMVGPVEVEQVVHTFSHETGFITEIKPSALVFANEISGWPMVEGMKLFAMAIQDIHSKYHGLNASQSDQALGDPGIIDTVASGINNTFNSLNGAKLDSFMKEKYNRIFGTDGASTKDVIGESSPPNLKIIDGVATDLFKDLGLGVGIAGTALALGGSIGTFDQVIKSAGSLTNATGLIDTLKSLKAVDKAALGKVFVKSPIALASVAAVVGGGLLAASGFGSAIAINQIEFPSIAWLMGSNILFLQCLRNDAIILVPLIKGGTPIVAGLATNDPALIWKSYKGRIDRMAQETLAGTSDMLQLYSRYGPALWEQANADDSGAGLTGTLTGEPQGIVNP